MRNVPLRESVLRTALLSVVAALVVLAACGKPPPTVTREIGDIATMEETIRRHVPVGTPVGKARRFMEHEGFRCQFKENGGFRAGCVVTLEIDFLSCERTDGSEPFVRHWRVALVVRDDAVSDILIWDDSIGRGQRPVQDDGEVFPR